MPPRHNPRRNVGAPVRLEDDETYLSERPRDPTKPAWPKLLAQSTLPYDPTLPPIPRNTKSLDQPVVQIPKRASKRVDAPEPHLRSQVEVLSEQLKFISHDDLDMATSESEGEGSDEHQELREATKDADPVPLNWSSLDPALQLSMYEYIYQFLQSQDKDKPAQSRLKSTQFREKAGKMLGLTECELADIEPQRKFRLSNPLTEDYLQRQWLKTENEMMKREDPLSKNVSDDRKKRQEMKNSYTVFMVHISKYKYTNESAMKVAKAYLKACGLKPKVVGEWTEAEEETSMMLVSTQPASPLSPIILPVTLCSHQSPVTQVPPSIATHHISHQAVASQPPHVLITNLLQTQSSSQSCSSLPEIKNNEDFARRHDTELIEPPRSVGPQPYRRDRLPVRPSDLLMKVNIDGKAEIRKKSSKRRASDLRQSYPDENVTGVRVVVLENGRVGFDVGTYPTPEVESLLRTGIHASRRGHVTDLRSQLQEPAALPSSAPRTGPRRFSDLLLGINSDHMPASTFSDFVEDDDDAQSLAITSTPPQPAWSPIASPNSPASASPTKSTPNITDAKPLQTVHTQVKPRLTEFQSQEYPPLPFDLRTNSLDINEAKENLNSVPPSSSSRYDRASSTPLLFPEPISDHDSGIGTSRATSTEPDIAKHEKKTSRKQPRQMDNHKVTSSKRKTGKGARGGTGAYNTKRKVAEKEMVAAALPLTEKTNAGTTRSTSHAA